MTKPTIHDNGTPARHLSADYSQAADAIHEARVVLAKCGPNPRDYYPQGAGAFERACDEHSARMEALAKVIEELAALNEHVTSCG